MKYFPKLIAVIALVMSCGCAQDDAQTPLEPTEQELVADALAFLGEDFTMTSIPTQVETQLVMKRVPRDSLDIRIDLTSRALLLYAVNKTNSLMYQQKFNQLCSAEGNYKNASSRFNTALEPLIALGEYYYQNGIDKVLMIGIGGRHINQNKILNMLAMLLSPRGNARIFVQQITKHSMSVSFPTMSCAEFYRNIDDWILMYKR